MATPDWTNDTERLVLALAIRADLLARAPGFSPQLFGSVGSSSSLSPRQRLAALIKNHWSKYGSPPQPEATDQAVVDERKKLSPEEGAALDRELGNVLACRIPENPEWIYDLARGWVDYRRVADGINAAAETLTGGPETIPRACELLAKVLAPVGGAEAAGGGRGPLGRQGLGDFLASARLLPPLETYIEGLLSSEGSGWLAGEEKVGKTFYALDEALCLALGLPVLGRFKVPTRRRVLFIEEEDPPRRVYRRVRQLLRWHNVDPDDDPAVRAELNEWFRIDIWSGFTFDAPAQVARLDAAIVGFQPDVIYIDVVRKVTTLNLNKADEATKFLNFMDAPRRKYGVIFRAIHHFRKVQTFRSGRGSQEMSGSYVLGAWGEDSLFFEPIGRKEGQVRVTPQRKEAPPASPFRLVFEYEGPADEPTSVRLRAEDMVDVTAEGDEEVYRAIAALEPEPAAEGKPGVSKKAITERLGKSEPTVRRALDRLEDAKRVLVTGFADRQRKLYKVNDQ